MVKITLTKEQVEAVVIELKRRYEDDCKEGEGYYSAADLTSVLIEKKQGAYSALMAIADNWPDVVDWLDEYFKKHGLYYGL